ncbi:MAG: hypoxanthine-guanine phosphoribosyltransferase [Xanthomonadaceae bacterium]|jgi:hypoxanthine phosphoribosyltransferase|nr:hypoxanthine-guanine phosphoribosyltransferase [Xanthomonadaceae bacterium]
MTDHLLSEALAKADLIHDRATLLAAITRMGAEIDRDYAGKRPIFMPVMNGGLIVGGHLALAIATDMEFDYCHATRYRSGIEGHSLIWAKAPKLSMRDRHVLLVDDILDEGYTLAAVIKHCYAEGAASVRIAVLSRKVHDRCVPGLKADYVGVELPDRWVFGFGMDYYEQGRNLPGIWAL